MKPGHVNVAPRAWEMLDEAGVHRLTEVLHARRGDCQACVRPLAGHNISLAVDEVTPRLAIAGLYHTSCREARWNDSGATVYVTGACTFALGHWVTRTSDDGPSFVALMLNPALESVFLSQADGAWRPELPEEYLKLGMQHPSRCLGQKTPLLAKVKVLLHDSGFVQLDFAGIGRYPADDGDRGPAPRRLVQMLRRDLTALVCVSQAADPAEVTELEHLQAVLEHPMTVCGEAVVFTAPAVRFDRAA